MHPPFRRYEAGERQPIPSAAVAIANALDVSVAEPAGNTADRLDLSGDWSASWQTSKAGGEVNDTTEARAALHTRRGLVSTVVERTRQEHEYELACVTALPIVDGDEHAQCWCSAFLYRIEGRPLRVRSERGGKYRPDGMQVDGRCLNSCRLRAVRASNYQRESPMAVEPSGSDLRSMLNELPDGPIVMLNLLRFASDGRSLYNQYTQKARPLLQRYGGELLYAGDGTTPLVAEEGQDWDAVLLVRYPDREAFTRMVADPEYQEIASLRARALAEAVLQPTLAWGARSS
ncbi:uncharacterized protein (DUF1330 family) [Actinopolyspora biskrensis]|uniref:Uncharacterized protein (DUF1330 family) n=2 Tax=Actinopolyspora biskrensis TaxID=1470178 RepID=A0A852YWR4_9ACTN|nr:uncharacterized protein (DUF1330 family) [Actinopolyspora biskrensis]